ncbi:hypothetical protein FN846DRAFT_887325 [Sphaerosporella brunnea]|uniref:Uncharacterized protein n=1 Tax=Sphaerosporella brunnea TaxID=1250544 RepID=A0A5J5F6U0_9PEZI|nr:hypothetical protein FN846DRAFT_887325 [Sphaerosporella brunnea]
MQGMRPQPTMQQRRLLTSATAAAITNILDQQLRGHITSGWRLPKSSQCGTEDRQDASTRVEIALKLAAWRSGMPATARTRQLGVENALKLEAWNRGTTGYDNRSKNASTRVEIALKLTAWRSGMPDCPKARSVALSNASVSLRDAMYIASICHRAATVTNIHGARRYHQLKRRLNTGWRLPQSSPPGAQGCQQQSLTRNRFTEDTTYLNDTSTLGGDCPKAHRLALRNASQPWPLDTTYYKDTSTGLALTNACLELGSARTNTSLKSSRTLQHGVEIALKPPVMARSMPVAHYQKFTPSTASAPGGDCSKAHCLALRDASVSTGWRLPQSTSPGAQEYQPQLLTYPATHCEGTPTGVEIALKLAACKPRTPAPTLGGDCPKARSPALTNARFVTLIYRPCQRVEIALNLVAWNRGAPGTMNGSTRGGNFPKARSFRPRHASAATVADIHDAMCAFTSRRGGDCPKARSLGSRNASCVPDIHRAISDLQKLGSPHSLNTWWRLPKTSQRGPGVLQDNYGADIHPTYSALQRLGSPSGSRGGDSPKPRSLEPGNARVEITLRLTACDLGMQASVPDKCPADDGQKIPPPARTRQLGVEIALKLAAGHRVMPATLRFADLHKMLPPEGTRQAGVETALKLTAQLLTSTLLFADCRNPTP